MKTKLQKLLHAKQNLSAYYQQEYGRSFTWWDAYKEAKKVLRGRYALRRCTYVGALPRVEGPIIISNGGSITLGDRITLRSTQAPIELATLPGAVMSLGNQTSISGGTSICAQKLVTIGKNCGIGPYCLIMDTDFHDVEDRQKQSEALPVCIADNVWLAARVTVLKGVTIGEGAIVSAGSVVALDVPAYTLVGGVPARVIRKLPRPLDEATAQEQPASTPTMAMAAQTSI